jgi:hypothetical protein
MGVLRAVGKAASRLGLTKGTKQQMLRIADRVSRANSRVVARVANKGGFVSPAEAKSVFHQMGRVKKVSGMVNRLNAKRKVTAAALRASPYAAGAAVVGGAYAYSRSKRVRTAARKGQ